MAQGGKGQCERISLTSARILVTCGVSRRGLRGPLIHRTVPECDPRNAAARLRAGLVPCLCLLVLAVAGCSPERYPQTALLPLSDFARIGDHVQDQTFYWALGVFILVEGALLYAIFRFRGRPDDPEPRQIHGNTTIEIIWTVIPALILAAIAVPTVKGIFLVNATPTGNLLEVEVVGHQWWWEFRYPRVRHRHRQRAGHPGGPHGPLPRAFGRTWSTACGRPRFAGKRDVFPGRETRIWFKADSTGLYPGQCAEFCGIQHARMAFHVRSETPEAFEAWVAHMQTLGPPKAAQAPAPAGGDTLRTASAGASVQQEAQADRAGRAGRDPVPEQGLYRMPLASGQGCAEPR